MSSVLPCLNNFSCRTLSKFWVYENLPGVVSLRNVMYKHFHVSCFLCDKYACISDLGYLRKFSVYVLWAYVYIYLIFMGRISRWHVHYSEFVYVEIKSKLYQDLLDGLNIMVLFHSISKDNVASWPMRVSSTNHIRQLLMIYILSFQKFWEYFKRNFFFISKQYKTLITLQKRYSGFKLLVSSLFWRNFLPSNSLSRTEYGQYGECNFGALSYICWNAIIQGQFK